MSEFRSFQQGLKRARGNHIGCISISGWLSFKTIETRDNRRLFISVYFKITTHCVLNWDCHSYSQANKEHRTKQVMLKEESPPQQVMLQSGELGTSSSPCNTGNQVLET